jgi:hypothetical protein
MDSKLREAFDMEPFKINEPVLGCGLDPESADLIDEVVAVEEVRGPGEGDAVIMTWARAM